MGDLARLCREWEIWAASANRGEDGWQTDYPAWAQLLTVAQVAMTAACLDAAALRDLDLCWAISEEDEPLIAYAQEHFERCRPTLRALARAGRPETRWQIMEVLGVAVRDVEADAILRSGLDDPDPYCRRRALLSLARFAPPDARELAERFLAADDPCLRQAAIEMVRASGDSAFIAQTRGRLLSDSVWHVREAARSLRSDRR